MKQGLFEKIMLFLGSYFNKIEFTGMEGSWECYKQVIYKWHPTYWVYRFLMIWFKPYIQNKNNEKTL